MIPVHEFPKTMYSKAIMKAITLTLKFKVTYVKSFSILFLFSFKQKFIAYNWKCIYIKKEHVADRKLGPK